MSTRGKSKEVKKHLREMLPLIPMEGFLAIEEIADAGHLRHLPPSIRAWQAITTHARHIHTDYDALLMEGYDKESARHFVLDDINEKLSKWGCVRKLDNTEE